MKAQMKEWLILTAGTLLVAIGIYYFKFPNHFSTGGVSGISIILGGIIPNISSGMFVFIINLIMLILGFLFFGKLFGIKTVYCSMLLSAVIFVLEKITPLSAPLTSQPLLELVFSVAFPAAGSAILFNYRASTGGTDIAAMILRKYTSVNIGTALFCTDALIALTSGVVFGLETGMYSVLGLLAKALVVDNMIESINLSKSFTIVTSKAEEINSFIISNLHRGATIFNGTGSFSQQTRSIILTVLNRSQAVKLKQYVKSVDQNAFIIINNTSDIIGKGFRESV